MIGFLGDRMIDSFYFCFLFHVLCFLLFAFVPAMKWDLTVEKLPLGKHGDQIYTAQFQIQQQTKVGKPT